MKTNPFQLQNVWFLLTKICMHFQASDTSDTEAPTATPATTNNYWAVEDRAGLVKYCRSIQQSGKKL